MFHLTLGDAMVYELVDRRRKTGAEPGHSFSIDPLHGAVRFLGARALAIGSSSSRLLPDAAPRRAPDTYVDELDLDRRDGG